YKGLSARRRRIDAEFGEEVAVIIADPADNPELVLQKKNQAELVRQSLARLSPEHGEIIDLVYYHGKIGQGGCRDCRSRRGHGQDAHVLCAQKTSGATRGGIESSCADRLHYRRLSREIREHSSRRFSPERTHAGSGRRTGRAASRAKPPCAAWKRP